MASLIIINNITHSNKPYPLGRRSVVIGRGENLPVQVLDDQVSRKHLKICYDKRTRRYFVWDMHSRNGVFLNDMKVSMETALLEGDHLRIGHTQIVFTEQDLDDGEASLHQYKRPGECRKQTYVCN